MHVATQVDRARWPLDERREEVGGVQVDSQHERLTVRVDGAVSGAVDAGVVDDGIEWTMAAELVDDGVDLVGFAEVADHGACGRLQR